MGLDQYACARLPEQNPAEVQPNFTWRKHAKLQEFMEQLWIARTGQPAEELNCNRLELQAEDIATLQALIERNELPDSPGGFFYGHQFQEESASEYRDRDLEFCQWARAILRTRQKVFYSCWW
jgi:hypothetical protein